MDLFFSYLLSITILPLLSGLHLNLTEGHPLSAKEDVFTLIGSGGMMLGKTDFRNAVKEGFVDLKEVCFSAKPESPASMV